MPGMGSRTVFLSVSDVRGNLDLLARAIDLANAPDIRAQAVFVLGNFCGPLLTPPEFASVEGARRVLLQEMKSYEQHYADKGVSTVWQMVDEICGHPERYRRGPEVVAATTIRSLMGRRDAKGGFLEVGSAGRRAQALYHQAEALFSKSKIPCYLMADTIFAEEAVPEERWLHFSWISVGGYSVRCLGASEIEDPDSIPDYFVGVRRGRKAVKVEDYPIASADIILSYVLNPQLHDVLSTSQSKLAVMCGDGQFDTGYPRNVVSTQRPGSAYVYVLDNAKAVRRTYDFANGVFQPGPLETGIDEASSRRTVKAERETQLRLAGLGHDLVVFCDLMKKENPQLAEQMERAANRGEAVFRYVQYLEAQRETLREAMAADRVGLERALSKLLPYLTADQARTLHATIGAVPEVSAGIEARDRAHERIAALVEELLRALAGAEAAKRR